MENKEVEVTNDTNFEDPIKCFAIMPFSKEFTNIWNSIQICIEELSKEETSEGRPPIIVRRADEHVIDSRLNENVKNNIKNCDIAIIDVTNENPNVIFEFGYAIAHNKNFIPITQTSVASLASDYKSYIYLQYDKDDLQHFKSRLRLKLISEIRRIKDKEILKELETKNITVSDSFHVDCLKNRDVADLKSAFRQAKNDISIIQTNMDSIVKEYASSIKTALDHSPNMKVKFLSLNPESYFAAIRARQLGYDVAEFRNELHTSLYNLYIYFKDYENVKIKIYDDFPTQISFIIDGEIYNCVVSKYQQSRSNCLFKLDSRYPSLHTSFNLHFTSVWRDEGTTKKYIPIYKREFPSLDK